MIFLQDILVMRPDLRLTLTVLIVALAGTAIAMALPFAYPDTPTWIWRFILYGSIIVSLAALPFLIYDLVIHPNREDKRKLGSFLTIAGTILIVSGALIGLVGAFMLDAAPSASTPQSSLKPKTLEELFKQDFPTFFKFQVSFTITVPPAGPVNYVAQAYKDLPTRTFFLGVYIPASPFTVSACIGIAQDYQRILRETSDAVFEYTIPGEHFSMSSKDLKFNGRIYIYHETDLTMRDIADLADIYTAKGLSVQFRGRNYVSEAFREELLRSKVSH